MSSFFFFFEKKTDVGDYKNNINKYFLGNCKNNTKQVTQKRFMNFSRKKQKRRTCLIKKSLNREGESESSKVKERRSKRVNSKNTK